MNILIIGMGNIGCTIGADLARKGHKITLLKTTENFDENYCTIERTKKIFVEDHYLGNYESYIDKVTCDFEQGVIGAQVIIICVQTNYHEDIIKKMSPFLTDGQIVVFEPGYLSTCYLLKHCNKKITSIEAESSPIDCRIISPGKCKVLFKNVLNPFGVYPIENKLVAEKVLKEIGYNFRFTNNVIEAALHNPNLIVHTVGALFSIPRIEYTKGNYWMYKEVFTPHVWSVCEALDDEKMIIMEKAGVPKKQSYVEACQERNFVDDNRKPLEAFFDYAMNSSPAGPSIPDSRYITEDVSQGLVLLESCGKYYDVETPVCTGLINLASAALGVDFRKHGRTINKLGLDNIKKINQI